MMLCRLTGILALLLVGVQSFAQYSDEQLFDAYLRGEMDVWRAYIDLSAWDKLDDNERARVLNYEYGYCGALMTIGREYAMPYVQQFGRHIDAMENELPISLWHVYKSAHSTYELSLTKRQVVKHKQEIFHHAEQAIVADSRQPLSWGIRAHVHFYAPRFLGGNKRMAQTEYEHADSIFTANAAEHMYNWAYAAQAYALAQCYEYNNQHDKAVKQAKILLKRWPAFQRAKDLLKKLQENK